MPCRPSQGRGVCAHDEVSSGAVKSSAASVDTPCAMPVEIIPS